MTLKPTEPVPKNQLRLKRKAGGCIVKNRPVFSHDGTSLFVAENYWIHVFNTTTGAKIREYCVPSDSFIICWENLSTNKELLCICTNRGELFFWNWRNGLETMKKQLKMNPGEHIVKASFMTCETPDSIEILTTYSRDNQSFLKLKFHRVHQSITRSNIDVTSKYEKLSLKYNHHLASNSTIFVFAINNEVFIGARDRKPIRHLISETRFVTSVGCHPFEESIVVGDNTGRVVIWRNIWDNRPVQGVYHWHTLPVNCCIFTPGGTHFYSGGDECVLVKWVVETPDHKQFLPRVLAPIKHVAVSSDNTQVAYAMGNNTIQLCDNQRNIKTMLENMSWGFVNRENDLNPFGAGLHYNPKTESIVMNSHTGHIQFYNPTTSMLIHHLDITERNKLTVEQNADIINIDVISIALSEYGQWLATVEQRDDLDCFECRLKFWQYNNKDQTWVLNTCVTTPHEKGIQNIKFKPSSSRASEETSALLISIGAKDTKFKTWDLVDTTSIYEKRFAWRNLATGYYLQKQACCLDFSYDGSLVAIGFESSLTIWLPDTCELKIPLVYTPFATEHLKQVIFGRSDSCFLVVTATENRICVWNLLSLQLVWTVPLHVTLMCADVKSSYIAAFTSSNKLYVFSPLSSQPVYQHELPCNYSQTLGAVFVPNKVAKVYKSWQQFSSLYFIDSNMELMTLEDESCPEKEYLESISVPVGRSLFMKAQSSLSTVEPSNQMVDLRRQLPGAVSVQDFIKVPSHTSAPMRFMCESVLKSLVATTSVVNKEPSVQENESDDDDDVVKNYFKLVRNPQQIDHIDISDSD